jgi:hypothetical protein
MIDSVALNQKFRAMSNQQLLEQLNGEKDAEVANLIREVLRTRGVFGVDQNPGGNPALPETRLG